MPQESIRWQGTQRRACGPGANWNVQVVRGKGTTRCLWHACKALGLGLFFMLLGACMATIGYYADQLSVAQEIRGNLTIKVKNKSREYHLNNLSYAGPIVMGVGGFIVVAACVMTFETRDSAAKVVPARFRLNQMSTLRNVKNQRNRRSTSSQTMKWDHQLGLFRVNRSPSPSTHETSRKQLKAEFIRFSKDLHDKGASHCIKKSPSAPTLIDKKSPRKETPRYAGCALLNPELLQRHALSVDNPAYSPPQVSRESLLYQKMTGSQASMTMDLHIPNKAPITLRVKDRSDTAKRHQLLRQTKVEDTEDIHETRRHIVNYVYSSRLPDVTMGQRKTSLEFRRSPDFRAGTYRKLSVDRYSVDCSRYFLDGMEFRSRTSSGENLKRTRYSKLHHSRSDDNRRRSFDRCQRESQSSRYSLNTQVTGESVGIDYEGKYFTGSSVETEESRTDNNPDDSLVLDLDDPTTSALSPVDGLIEADTLLEEPELENLTEMESETCCETTVQLSATIEATDEGSNAARNAEKDQARIRENETILRQTDASDVILYVEDDEV